VTGRTWVESTEVSARAKARKRALDLLFEAEQRGLNAEALLAERIAKPATQHSLNDYTVEIVRGVVAEWIQIDELLATYSQGWTVDRMPAVDRAILRIGAWEVVFSETVPDAVAISEAVALATTLSTDDSPTFVNGLLARISEVKPTLV
jgi:N utilization substance protein B